MEKNMERWGTAGKGIMGIILAISLEQWNLFMAAIAGTCTAIYMVSKVWKDVVKPYARKKGWIHK